MDRSSRDVVAELAGLHAEMAETSAYPEWQDMVVAELSGPDTGWHRIPGLILPGRGALSPTRSGTFG